MKIEAVRALKTDELHNELERVRKHLFDLRAQSVTEKLEDTTQIRKSRQDVARLLTVMRERGEKNIEQRQAQLSAQATKRK